MRLEKWSYVSVLAGCLLSGGCMEEPREVCGDVLEVGFREEGYSTRSSLVPDPGGAQGVGCVALAAYEAESGNLHDVRYSEGGADVSLKLSEGRSYRLYALANCGDVRAFFPVRETGLSAALELRKDGAGITGLVPMSGELYVPSSDLGSRVTMPLTRLAACCQLRINMYSSDRTARFRPSDIRVRQAACKVRPFVAAGSSRAEDSSWVCDGDRASEEDLRALEAGDPVCFYVTENSQPPIDNPYYDSWRKVPAPEGCIPAEQAALSTYLEVSGEWVSEGVNGPVTYRIYLGDNSYDDFSIVRNTLSTIDLYLSDEGLHASSWKVDNGGVEDTRVLEFSPGTLDVYQGLGTFTAYAVPSPPGMVFSMEARNDEERREAGLTLARDGVRMDFTASQGGVAGKSIIYEARGADGVLLSLLRVNVLAPQYRVVLLYSQDFYLDDMGMTEDTPIYVEDLRARLVAGGGDTEVAYDNVEFLLYDCSDGFARDKYSQTAWNAPVQDKLNRYTEVWVRHGGKIHKVPRSRVTVEKDVVMSYGEFSVSCPGSVSIEDSQVGIFQVQSQTKAYNYTITVKETAGENSGTYVSLDGVQWTKTLTTSYNRTIYVKSLSDRSYFTDLEITKSGGELMRTVTVRVRKSGYKAILHYESETEEEEGQFGETNIRYRERLTLSLLHGDTVTDNVPFDILVARPPYYHRLGDLQGEQGISWSSSRYYSSLLGQPDCVAVVALDGRRVNIFREDIEVREVEFF